MNPLGYLVELSQPVYMDVEAGWLEADIACMHDESMEYMNLWIIRKWLDLSDCRFSDLEKIPRNQGYRRGLCIDFHLTISANLLVYYNLIAFLLLLYLPCWLHRQSASKWTEYISFHLSGSFTLSLPLFLTSYSQGGLLVTCIASWTHFKIADEDWRILCMGARWKAYTCM